MSNDAPQGHGNSSDARQAIDQCLRTILNLRASDYQDPQVRSALLALSAAVNRLLALETPEPAQAKESTQKSTRVEDSSTCIDESDLADVSEPSENTFKHWRGRMKSSAEKQEKKARLEKREAILRDLRSRVTQYREEQGDKAPESEPAVQSSSTPSTSTPSFETFEMRRHRASFWPEGSVEWARQLLGIEMWMTHAEKRQRYVEMVRVCHPDQNQSVPSDAIQLVNAAWEVVRQ